MLLSMSCLEPGSESPIEDSPSTDRLRFERFDICRLLKHGASLLGSAGAEFEVQDDKSGISLYLTCGQENLTLLEKCDVTVLGVCNRPWFLRMLGNDRPA